MFGKKPVLVVYNHITADIDDYCYMNILVSSDGKTQSFRCPNKKCGKPVKIGFSSCSLCGTKLKWKFPFETMEIDTSDKNNKPKEKVRTFYGEGVENGRCYSFSFFERMGDRVRHPTVCCSGERTRVV